jgi:RNA polymerase primary sigma factor
MPPDKVAMRYRVKMNRGRIEQMATKVKKQADNDQTTQDASEAASIDAAQQTIKALLKLGKDRGFVTHDELNAALPAEEYTSEQIDDVMSTLNEMGVSVVDGAESDDDTDEAEEGSEDGRASGNLSDSDVSGTDDPVRMYLREMGSVELLSREGEISIAKRIEAGREMMIGGICESPLTIRALMHWRDQIADGVVPLRDIIDLEATFAKLKGNPLIDHNNLDGMDDEIPDDDLEDDEEEEEEEEEEEDEDEDEEYDESGDSDTDTSTRDAHNDNDENDDLNLSLAALEDAVRDEMMALFDEIGMVFGDYVKLQDRRLARMAKDQPLVAKSEMTHRETKIKLCRLMEGVIFNTNRIEALSEQLFTLNRHVTGIEGRLMRVATSSGIPRAQILEAWTGREVNEDWPGSGFKSKAWQKLDSAHGEEVAELRDKIKLVVDDVGLSVPEFREVIQTIQRGPKKKWSRPICGW